MKKVFAYIGSRNIDSKTLGITDKISRYFKERHPLEVVFDIQTPNNSSLAHCRGCTFCFHNGKCPIDKEEIDNSHEIKKKLESADFIILGSPVYFHNVTSDMKCLMDRLTYWCHLFRLAGKPGIIIVNADSNGVDVVTRMLQNFCNHLGIIIVDRVKMNCNISVDNDFIEQISNKIWGVLEGTINISTNEEMEKIYTGLKWIYSNSLDTSIEKKYWLEHKLFDYERLEDYINDINLEN